MWIGSSSHRCKVSPSRPVITACPSAVTICLNLAVTRPLRLSFSPLYSVVRPAKEVVLALLTLLTASPLSPDLTGVSSRNNWSLLEAPCLLDSLCDVDADDEVRSLRCCVRV
jgi:hypothetical protein